ncbi:MAG: Nif3-like dinuclear metal center hexameric protein [Thermoguttaceae bacterium]|nr:Nif3-like dinuclear metal center hexameric protein [Thermoguttaceae bacterium]
MNIAQFIESFLEPFAPLKLAEDWDNVGLLLGRRNKTVKRIMTCLTVTPQSAQEAVDKRVDLIVSHHPVLFRAVKRLTDETPEGAMLLNLIEHNVAVYAPHSAFDSAINGINQRIAKGVGLKKIKSLQVLDEQTGVGIGRIGQLSKPTKLKDFAAKVRDFFGGVDIDLVGKPDDLVHTVAVTCGAAGSLFDLVKQARADALILGETMFHTFLDAQANGVTLILPGHYATERFACKALAEEIAQTFPELDVFASSAEKPPVWRL